VSSKGMTENTIVIDGLDPAISSALGEIAAGTVAQKTATLDEIGAGVEIVEAGAAVAQGMAAPVAVTPVQSLAVAPLVLVSAVPVPDLAVAGLGQGHKLYAGQCVVNARRCGLRAGLPGAPQNQCQCRGHEAGCELGHTSLPCVSLRRADRHRSDLLWRASFDGHCDP